MRLARPPFEPPIARATAAAPRQPGLARRQEGVSLRSYASLLRWLGPWAADGAAPDRIERREIEIPFAAWVYRPPRPPTGALLIAPGLHYLGPADPRLDRFARILAASGQLVLAPFLPSYTGLRVEEAVIDELARAFEALLSQDDLPPVKPGVFSISFGSMPALRLCASETYADRVGAAVLFGGYADFDEAVRFCLGAGDPDRPRDPLNQPVVLMNVLNDLDEEVVQAWRAFIQRTWGRPEMKAQARFEPVARQIADDLPSDKQELFLVGVGVEPGAYALVEAALATLVAQRPYLDPRPHLHRIRCPVHVVHGLDDDVIPPAQLDALAAALPPSARAQTYLTGLYGHTGAAGGLASLPALAREGATLARMLRALVGAGSTRAS